MSLKPIVAIMTLLLAFAMSATSAGASPRAVGASDLAASYPQLIIRAKEDKFELSTRVVANRYLVTVNNQGKEGVDAQFVQIPEGRTVEEVARAVADLDQSTAWLYDANWAGGPTV